MNTLDLYIQRATRGLPRQERVDTAAELRSHLLEKIRELMQQGFSREEATHLAVQEMGHPGLPFRQRLRHFVQRQLGWWMLASLVLGTGVWWGKDHLFAPSSVVQALPLGPTELSSILSSQAMRQTDHHEGFKVVLPAGTSRVQVAVLQGAESGTMVLEVPRTGDLDGNGKPLPENFRFTWTLLMGVSSTPAGQNCGSAGTVVVQALLPRFYGNDRMEMASCTPREVQTFTRAISNHTPEGQPLQLNQWNVLWVAQYTPTPYTLCAHLSGKSKAQASCQARIRQQEQNIQQQPGQHPESHLVLALRPTNDPAAQLHTQNPRLQHQEGAAQEWTVQDLQEGP